MKHKNKLLICSAILLFLFIQIGLAQRQRQNNYEILLKSRQFTPNPGMDSALESELKDVSTDKVHKFIQFFHMPNASEKGILNEQNVELLTYIPNNAWYASLPADIESLQNIIELSFVRWIGPILPNDKIKAGLLEEGVGSWAVNEDGTVNLLVQFFDDVSLDDAKNIVSEYDISVIDESKISNILTLSVSDQIISELIKEDSISWIEEVPPPPTTDIFESVEENPPTTDVIEPVEVTVLQEEKTVPYESKNIFQKIWEWILNLFRK